MFLVNYSLLFNLFVSLTTLFSVIYFYFQWIYRTWERKKVPYFKPKFPLGNRKAVLQPVSIGEDIFSLTKAAKAKGWNYFGMFIGVNPFFVTVDLEIIKCILAKDFSYFSDRGIYYNEKDDPISAHLFSVGGSKWRNLRTKLTPTFTSGKIKGMFQTLVDCSSLLEQSLKQHNSNEPVDIKNTLICFTTDVIGSCAFGLECNSFKEPDSLFIKYGKKIFTRNTVERIRDIFAMSFPRLALLLHLKSTPTEVSKFFYNIVYETVSYRERNNTSRKDFLQLLIDIKNGKDEQTTKSTGNESSLTMDEIVAQCFVFFVAGLETSSTTVTFTLFELSQHPDIQEKVREELFAVLKKYENKMCYDAVKDLEYMQQVIDEALRLYPPGPFTLRKCVQDYKIPNSNIVLEKGTKVIIPIKNIHYDENNYENAEQFDPNRFCSEQRRNRNQYAHIPFGEGPRNCIGMRFGLVESKVALAVILGNFRVKLNPRTKIPLEMDPNSFITSTKGGMWLDLERIN